MGGYGERSALKMTDAKTPKTDDIIPTLVDGFSPQLVIAALVLGIVLGALIIVMLPDQVEDTNHDG